jgi:hypothetical protein
MNNEFVIFCMSISADLDNVGQYCHYLFVKKKKRMIEKMCNGKAQIQLHWGKNNLVNNGL